MNNDKIEKINKLNNIGKEPERFIGIDDNYDNVREDTFARNDMGNQKSNIKKRYRNWLLGFGMSIVPLAVVPILALIFGEFSVGEAMYSFFSNYEFVFVGISLSITAINSFVSQKTNENREGWVNTNFILIVLGAAVYGCLAYRKEVEPTVGTPHILVFNFIYLTIIFLLNRAKYLHDFKEVE